MINAANKPAAPVPAAKLIVTERGFFMQNKKLKVAVVGLGFGGAFVPIWRDHPDVACVGITDLDDERTHKAAETFRISKIYSGLDEVLADSEVDAVHLVTCIPDHAEQTVRVLEAGKHCACTVPMATSLADIRRITAAVRKSGKKYMMMETTLYTYHFFYLQQLLASGELGRIQFMRGSHYQDMENWPAYWNGLPPFWYGTHAIAPMVALSGSRIGSVSCLGSGTMAEERMRTYGNPFPVESAHFRFDNGLAAEATRSLFETARVYQEGLFVYGSKKSFEWGFSDGDAPYITELSDSLPGMRGRQTPYHIARLSNFYSDLPEELWPYTVGDGYDATNPQLSLSEGAGAGHHGSHAHLVNEFVRSILDDRRPRVDEVLAANITAAGICAHESALRGGEWITVPRF